MNHFCKYYIVYMIINNEYRIDIYYNYLYYIFILYYFTLFYIIIYCIFLNINVLIIFIMN